MEMKRRSSSTLNRLSFTINHLPDALVIDIFLRLPLKSAKLCMLVCKHWYALISTSDFGNSFLQLNYASTLLISYVDWPRNNKLFVSSENSIFRSHFFSLAYLPCGPSVVVVTSCGDLLLCCPDFDLHSVYYICNPLTEKWIQLPPTPSLPSDTAELQTGFIFQGSGISFRYAVVRVSYSDRDPWDDAIKFEIFTSDSGKWSEKVWNLNLENLVGTPYKGMLFWISCDDADNPDNLVGVDPFSEGEQIHFTALPPRPAKFGDRQLAVCRGILKLLETEMDGPKDALSLRLWDLKDFGKNEWDLKHHITFFGLLAKNPLWFEFEYNNPDVCPISCDSNNDGNIMYIVIEGRVVLLCNMNKQTFDVIHDGANHMFYNGGGAFIYVLPWQPTAIPSLLNAEIVS